MRPLIMFSLLAFPSGSAVAKPHYTLDLTESPQTPDEPSHATDINDDGYAIASFWHLGTENVWTSFIWKDGITSPANVGYALKINNHNQVVGYGGTASTSVGVFWDGTQIVDLDEVAGGQFWNRPYALNDFGRIYGYSLGDSNSVEGWEHAVRWTPDGQIFEMGIPANGTEGNIAQAANNAGQVVGYTDNQINSAAWIWQNGIVDSLPSLPNAIRPASWAYSINNNAEIVGVYSDPQQGTIQDAALWKNGELSILTTPTGTQFGIGYDINDAGYVVGAAYVPGAQHTAAILWDPVGTPYVLNDLVDNLQGLSLETAVAINNRKQIAGNAYDAQGIQHGFVLTLAIPEPPSIGTALLAVLGILLLPKMCRARHA
jgi:uncharacterized membrane protein